MILDLKPDKIGMEELRYIWNNLSIRFVLMQNVIIFHRSLLGHTI